MGGGAKVAVDEYTQVTDNADWFNGSTSDRDGTAIEEFATADVDDPTQRLRSISWSTVSNAAVRSSRTRTAVSPRSTESRRSDRTRIVAVSVDCHRRKPD